MQNDRAGFADDTYILIFTFYILRCDNLSHCGGALY